MPRRRILGSTTTLAIAALLLVPMLGPGDRARAQLFPPVIAVAGRGAGEGIAGPDPIVAPTGLARDAAGNLYVGDANNHRVLRLAPDGRSTTVAGTGAEGVRGDGGPAGRAELYGPYGLSIDATGNLYIAAGDRVRKVSPDGIITTVAGAALPPGVGFSGDGGPSVQARLSGAQDVLADPYGGLYIADSGNLRIRRIRPDGTIATVAGDPPGQPFAVGSINFAGDGGPAAFARLYGPAGMAMDARGDLFVADSLNQRVRKITPDGIVTTVAGSGPLEAPFYQTPGAFAGDGGPATEARLNEPTGVAVDAVGNLYIADMGNGRIRMVDPQGTIRTAAGGGGYPDPLGGIGDGGPATQAVLQNPQRVIVDAQGDLFIAESGRVRKVAPNGTISTVLHGDNGDGGPAVAALLSTPTGVAVDARGNTLIADSGSGRVRRIGPDGIITTVAGSGPTDPFLLGLAQGYGGDGGPAAQARLNRPSAVEVDVQGNLYIADSGNYRVRKVGPDGIITTIAGTGEPAEYPVAPGDGGAATRARLGSPTGVAVDGYGNLYIADGWLRKVTPDGVLHTQSATSPGSGGGSAANSALPAVGVALDAQGNIFTADGYQHLYKVDPQGHATIFAGRRWVTRSPNGFPPGRAHDGDRAIDTIIAYPQSVAVDAAGDLFVVPGYGGPLIKIDPTGRVATYPGVAIGGGVVADLNGAAVDGEGNLLLTSARENRVLKLLGVGSPGLIAGRPIPDLGPPPSLPLLTVHPSGALVQEGQSLPLQVTPNVPVTWSLVGDGTIGWDGVYAPPHKVTADHTVTVMATATAGGWRPALATIAVVAPQEPTGYLLPVAGRALGAFPDIAVPASGDGGPTTAAALYGPAGLAFDAAGNLYIADPTGERVRKVTPGGTITTAAGSGVVNPDGQPGFSGDGGPALHAQLNAPVDVAVDGQGRLYIADLNNERVRRVDPNGTITTVAGGGRAQVDEDGQALPDPDGGPATAAWISPQGIAVNTAGDLYIADGQSRHIRKVDRAGIITTVAGGAVYGQLGDGGPATQAWIGDPTGVALDAAGNLYIASTYISSSIGRVRKVSPEGTITSVIGGAIAFDSLGNALPTPEGGPAAKVVLNYPTHVAVDGDGNVYVTEGYGYRVRRASPDGTIAMVAGTGFHDPQGNGGFSGDGGPATQARMGYLNGLALDARGSFYISDRENGRVRRVEPDGTITTVAGGGTAAPGEDGPALAEPLNPTALAVGADGSVYTTDGDRVRRVSPDGTLTTVAGVGYLGPEGRGGFSGDGGPAVAAALDGPGALAVDRQGNVYIADRSNHRVRRVAPNGTITTVAGSGPTGSGLTYDIDVGGFSGDGGPAAAAQLSDVADVAVGPAGDLFLADPLNYRVRRVSPSGVITTVAGSGPAGLDPNTHEPYARFSGDGGPATQAALGMVGGVAVDAAGSLFIADRTNNRIRKVDPAGVIRTVAGTGLADFTGDGGPAVAATLDHPTKVKVDAAGSFFIVDDGNQRIRRVSPDGIITTVAGTGRWSAGTAPAGDLGTPWDVAVDAAGSLLIADSAGVIRKAPRLAGPGLLAGRPFPASSPPTFTPGDMNHDSRLDIHDVVLLLRAALGISAPSALDARIGDVYPDGRLGVPDVLLLLREVLGLSAAPHVASLYRTIGVREVPRSISQ